MATAVAVTTTTCATCNEESAHDLTVTRCTRCDEWVCESCAIIEQRGGVIVRGTNEPGGLAATPITRHAFCADCVASMQAEAIERAGRRDHEPYYDELVDEAIASEWPQERHPMAHVEDEANGVSIVPGAYCGRSVALTPIEVERVHRELGAWIAAQKRNATAATVAGLA